jgi:hypothetical protein
MKKIIFAMMLALVLVGCTPSNYAAPDQCLRSQLFQQCMAILPKGPDATVYNDWDEVVDSCASTAYSQSLRPVNSIKPECSQGR